MGRTKQAKRDAKHLFRLCLVNGLLDEGRVREVVKRAAASKNRNRLKLLSYFERLVRLDQVQHTATVESAAALSVEVQASIENALSRKYGALTMTFTDSPELIGGMRIKVGSDVYDSSVKAKLAAIQACF
jgi:F-type H+-transporting ATPase subunit delta